eukprot:2354417-Heterocapsa_arctica.AAC.1
MTNVGAKCFHLQVAGRLRSEDDLEELGALLEAAAVEEGLDVGVLPCPRQEAHCLLRRGRLATCSPSSDRSILHCGPRRWRGSSSCSGGARGGRGPRTLPTRWSARES